MQQIELCVEAEMALIAELRPDAVVGDFRPTLSISCELSRRPYIAVASACWTRYSALAPRAPWGHILGRLCGQRAADWAFSRLRARMLRRCIAPFNDFCHRRGLPPRRSILDLLESRFLNLLTDVPQLFPLTRQPSHYCYIGPALWEPYPTPPEWFGRLRNDLPTICVNMPAAGLVEMLHAALDTLGHSNTQLVMTTGGPEPTASLPPNCFVDRFALSSRIVERSDMVVCHGDSDTVYQALAAGVPVLGIPTTLEQEVNVRRAEELGVGLTLPVRRLTAARLAEAANELLTRPSYRTRAAELARSIKSYDAATLGAKAIIKRLNQVRNADCGVRSDEELPVA
jgi:UDP:flavonoid glycosyltransferase YjiC (YdhE family)